jgi:gliding motility-associated-like protein
MVFLTLLTRYWPFLRCLRYLLLVLGSLGLAREAKAQSAPAYQWALAATGIGYPPSKRVGVDALGNAYMAGEFTRGSITFGTTTLLNRGSTDVYLAKYTPQGQLLWVQQLAGVGIDAVTDLAIDATGNAYLTGWFGADYTPPPPYPKVAITVGSTTLTGGSLSQSELFLVKFDPQGKVLWAHNSVGLISSSSSGSLVLDQTGNVYLLGSLGNGSSLTQFSLPITSPFNPAFLAKFNNQGTLQWLKSSSDYGDGELLDLAVDATGSVFVVGVLNKRFRAGTTTVTPQLATPNYFVALELYLVKLDTQGQGLWGQYLSYTAYQPYVTSGSAAHTYGDVALAVNAQGDVLCARTFMGRTMQSGHTFVAKGGTDIALLAYSGQGAYKWSTQVGGPDPVINSDQIHGLAVDNAGNCYLGMLLTGMQTLTQYSGTSNIYCYFASFAPDGSMRWVRPTGAIVLDVAARAADEVWVTGYFEYTQKFDSFSLTAPTGSYSPFLARLTAGTSSPTPTPTPTPPLVTSIPNIITPNGDGLNDTFRPQGLPAGPLQLRVFSRWGQPVFETANYTLNWDAPGLPAGLYYYLLQAPGQAPAKGWVEVVR